MARTLKSPCIRNCCLNEDDICLGCFRSMKEIMQWSAADEETKLHILKESEDRKRLAQNKNI
ncbi:MAG: DUF1289 domain-containing protein [Pseudomonadales bacterium]|nr:DUF1289 domain-containing protein [Pseudomonadales bacterium]